MGSDQSRETTTMGVEATEDKNLAGTAEEALSGEPMGRDSPRPSICSDGDLPYISYTVNRPIGDSPKHLSKGVRALRSSGSPRKQKKRLVRPQEVIVVKEGNANKITVDSDLARLQNIPTFLPIMRGALTAPSARDPEVLERLDSVALSGLCRRYQIHLHASAVFISSHQDDITKSIKATDDKMGELVSVLTDRQRAYARHAERLQQVTEVNHLLTKCHTSLNLLLESMETLNNMLPLDQRLEPFIWTTG